MLVVKLLKSVFFASALAFSLQAVAAIKTYDLMVLYTQDMVNSQYGSDLDARFAYLEDYTNQTLTNSRVNSQVRIVYAGPTPSGYSTLANAQLGQARTDSRITALRQQHGADFVVIMGNASGFCGLGYVLQGNSNTGKLYSNSASYAYSLVDYNCGGGTFAHELGHNFSLGHSVEQGSKGGVWDWARGHGKSGKWITTMAYSSYYGGYSANRLQYYSNPDISECEGAVCGIKDSADSSKNLNLLAEQHADFMPQVYSNSNSGSSQVIAIMSLLL